MSPALRVGVVSSRFPKLSETFILDELVSLEREGVEVVAMPLHLERPSRRHPDADRFAAAALAAPAWSRHALRAQLHWLRRAPRAYLGAWAGALRGTWRSPSFLLRAPLVVLLGARIADDARRAGITRLHAHYATHPALACWVAQRLTGIPWSMTVHAHDIQVDTTMLGEKARAADFVVAISQANAAIVRRAAGPEAAIHVVHCGVDVDRLRPRPRVVADPGSPFIVSCVASLEPYKGHIHLLRAIARVAGAGVDVRLMLAGDGPLRAALHRQARELGIAGRVRFLGPRDRDEVAGLLARSDAFALASVVTAKGKCEGIPVALMEAMACGLPVVATDVGGVGELVHDGVNGRLVAPADDIPLAAALTDLACLPELAARLGARGRATVLAEFDRRTSTRRLAELLRGAGSGRVEDPAGGLEHVQPLASARG